LINHSIPSCIPSLALAEQAIIDHSLSLIFYKVRVSEISSGGRANNKSCLFANINNGTPARVLSSRSFCNSSPLSANLLLSEESITNTRASVFSK